jgi:hypothetical protein
MTNKNKIKCESFKLIHGHKAVQELKISPYGSKWQRKIKCESFKLIHGHKTVQELKISPYGSKWQEK